ncbi:hypothetical protein [Nesterenkonia pannonica]|uniref:hypothetical protein n=1 Tax=Nesterenkonia pannonica TaxID=1548602 RepID=UPI0021647738|nr:hypothetical protein [Nesterenkonia pannonica]
MSDQDMLGGLKSQLGDYAQALGRKAINSVSDRVDDFAERIESGGGAAGEGVKAGAEKMAEGKSPVSAAASGVASGAQAKVKDALPGGPGPRAPPPERSSSTSWSGPTSESLSTSRTTRSPSSRTGPPS